MKLPKKSLKSSVKTTSRATPKAEPVRAKAPSRPAVADPEKKPAKRSLLAAAVEGMKAVVGRSTKKPKSEPSPAPVEAPAPAPMRAVAVKPAGPASGGRSGTKAAPRVEAVELPATLLEGDESAAPRPAGPGERYVLGPEPVVEKFPPGEDLGELPEAYGTGRLMLAARDPHWLYAHWDFTQEQIRKFNRASRDGHLLVRVLANAADGKLVNEIHVHPESRNWFLHVGRSEATFVAELGYYAKKTGKWVSLGVSRPATTPPDTMSDDTSVRFATIPVELSFAQMLSLLKQAVRDNVSFIEAVQQLRATGHRNLPDERALTSSQWTPAQEKAMAGLISMDAVRRVWMGSLEITELLRRQLVREISSISAARLSLPSSISVSSLASPFGGMPGRRKGFWFNVNAELIIYGATEPDAAVTIGGRKIRLRSDGTFSYRFALPDGNFNLPAIATSADGTDTRIADLAFRRHTEYSGDVGAHPQDAALRPPKAEHVA